MTFLYDKLMRFARKYIQMLNKRNQNVILIIQRSYNFLLISILENDTIILLKLHV